MGNITIWMPVEVNCPHCGRLVKHIVEEAKRTGTLDSVWCDYEDGGCDKRFMVEVFVEPRVKVFKLVDAEPVAPDQGDRE